MAGDVNGLNNVGGVYENVTGEKPKTKGLKDVVETRGVFDVAKDAGVPTGGVKDVAEKAGIPTGGLKDVAEKAGIPTGGAIEAVTGKEMPKMGLVHMIDKYGKGIYQTVRGWFGSDNK